MHTPKLKTINIKGKLYVPVSERVRAFHKMYPNGKISTTYIEIDSDKVVIKATVTPDTENENRYFTGYAEETRGQGMINKTNSLENCETSAVGRALGFLGIGSIESIASADEVQGAVKKQDSVPNQNRPIPTERPTMKEPNAPATEKQLGLLEIMLSRYGMPREAFKSKYNIDSMKELTKGKASAAIDELQKRVDAGEKYEAEEEIPTINVD